MRARRIWSAVLGSVLLLGGALVAGCQRCDPQAPGLFYLGQAVLPLQTSYGGTLVGGLSGISYDPERDCYYVISDDRSAHGPARFYTMRIPVSERGVDDVVIGGVQALLDVDGRPFGPQDFTASPPIVPPDPEGIAFDAGRQRLYWSSEGERLTHGPNGAVLADPWVRIAGLDGRYLGQFAIPPEQAMSVQARGPRRNTAIEGLTMTGSGRTLFAAMEGPGFADGALPNHSHGALTRITAYRLDSGSVPGAPEAQYAYPLEPTAERGQRDATNGLTDLVALSESAFLVVERGSSIRPSVKLFRAEIAGATDVLGIAELTRAAVVPMTKTLLADLSSMPGMGPLDNIEGLTLGPRLPDGRQTLVLVSDDNFSPRQLTQFVAFAMPVP